MLHPFKDIMPQLASSVFVVDSAQIIGDVRVGADSSIWFNVVIRGDVNHIRIGERTNIQDGTVIHVTNKTHPTVIGDEVTVGHNATLHGCLIKDCCLIGIGAIVLDGAVIGEESLVAAGSVVAPGTLVPAGTLVMGAPAKVKRELTADERANLKSSAQNYLQYARAYRQQAD